jgi:hypothetical protein
MWVEVNPAVSAYKEGSWKYPDVIFEVDPPRARVPFKGMKPYSMFLNNGTTSSSCPQR